MAPSVGVRRPGKRLLRCTLTTVRICSLERFVTIDEANAIVNLDETPRGIGSYRRGHDPQALWFVVVLAGVLLGVHR